MAKNSGHAVAWQIDDCKTSKKFDQVGIKFFKFPSQARKAKDPKKTAANGERK